MSSERHIYKILFLSQGEVYELYARQVSQGGLQGFVEVGELVFGERTEVVVDPGEERLQQEFDGVRRFYIPFHAVLRIDEVERAGKSRITEAGEEGSVTPFPAPPGQPEEKPDGEGS